MTARARPSTGRILALLGVGILGGLLSGLFGVGGGILMIPLLILLAGLDQRTAAATSLAAIVPTAIAGASTYAANGQIDLVAAALLALGGIGGSAIGSRLLRVLPIGVLRWAFIGLLLAVAVRMALVVPARADAADLDLPRILGFIALGLVIGIVSGLFGIGGGVIAVPALIAIFGIGDLTAKGTSLLMMIPTALAGTIGNARARLVDWTAVAIAGTGAVAASFAGVALAFLIPARLSGVIFAGLLLVSAVQLAVRAIRARRTPRD
ncbi:sulfite exporter TauE/SafE family protein [Homoserinibacter sp. YIM 151385]|uniref:sulfite exporter TauE/SafE family protein n=1 Tax=Homoserinibacter sp. YIM 151385 TaxID=2985506 RepID=UPI0022F0F16E|nr:sulfite exporter TauE/SafE family protein [Homoserinibacter sp. YIM 151385]WBU39171.1 sulfite exporter TauE/SafE family protein [Homoserinibacter sp. YIM 151385]